MTLLMETDEARMALDAGFDPGDPLEFLTAMLAIKDSEPFRNLVDYLTERGLTIGQVYDLVAPAVQAESDAEGAAEDCESLLSKQARRTAGQLHARGFPTPTIARLIDVPVERVEVYLASRNTVADEQQIVLLHRQGMPSSQIAKAVGSPRKTVQEVLRRNDLEPHLVLPRVTQPVREQIIRLRNDGKQYPQIQEATGASRSQVISVLRTAAAKGMVPDYGKRAK